MCQALIMSNVGPGTKPEGKSLWLLEQSPGCWANLSVYGGGQGGKETKAWGPGELGPGI